MWLTSGEGVILFGDVNLNLHTPYARSQLASMGLSDDIAPFLNEDETFSTYDRGSTVIYGFWITGEIRAKQGGYLPFGTGLPPDNRCALIDIENSNLLGNDPEPIICAQSRKLQCKNSAVRARFENAYTDHMITHNMRARSRIIEEASTEQRWTSTEEAERETLEKLRIEGVKQASHKRRKLCIGNIDWIPKATQLKNIVLFWRLCCHRAQGTKPVIRRYHRQIQKLAHLQDAVLPSYIQGFVECYKLAQKEWRVFAKTQATEERTSFLEGLASAEAEANPNLKVDVANKLNRLRWQEEQLRAATSIKYALGKYYRGGVFTITYKNKEGQIVEATSKEEMGEVVMKANKQKKIQAQNTPFMQEPLASEVGWTGVGEAAKYILNGTCSPLGHLSTFTLDLILELKRNDKAKLNNRIIL
jgi:hypothetical protein